MVQKLNALTAARSLATEEVTEKTRACSSLARLQLIISGISADVESEPDQMGNSICEEIQALERRVCGATIQSLQGFRNKFFVTSFVLM